MTSDVKGVLPDGQGYGQVGSVWAGDGGSDYQDSTAGDSPTGAGGRTELSPDENGAIVGVLDYLVGNFQHLYSGDASPLYNAAAAATHTLE